MEEYLSFPCDKAQDRGNKGNETGFCVSLKEDHCGRKTVIREHRKRIMMKRIIESAPSIIYLCAEDFRIMDDFIPAISGSKSTRTGAKMT